MNFFPLLHRFQTDSGAHPDPYPMDAEGSFNGDKETVAWSWPLTSTYEGVSKSFRTGRLEQELQMVQLSATVCSYIAILWVSLVSFAAITLRVASQRMFVVVSVYFVIDSVRKLLDTLSYCRGVRMLGSMPPLPKTSPWRGTWAQG
jgi:hypothetical protein